MSELIKKESKGANSHDRSAAAGRRAGPPACRSCWPHSTASGTRNRSWRASLNETIAPRELAVGDDGLHDRTR